MKRPSSAAVATLALLGCTPLASMPRLWSARRLESVRARSATAGSTPSGRGLALAAESLVAAQAHSTSMRLTSVGPHFVAGPSLVAAELDDSEGARPR